MTDRELMQQALQALEFLSCGDEIDEALIVALRQRLEQPTTTAGYAKKIESLVAERDALKANLAQPEQQDYWQEEARRYAQNAEFWRGKYEAAIAQQQEPVAWVEESAIRWLADRKGKTSAHCTTQLSAARSFEQSMPIYTTPPRPEWVGLTDEEKSELDAEYGDDTLAHLDAIEAKLKEKNT